MTSSTGFPFYPPFLFSLVFPAMIKLFKRNTSTDTCHHHHHYHHHPLLGLGLATTDVHRPPNVLESAMLKPNSDVPRPKKTQIGSLDEEVVCFVSGLASCTETLGCESSDQIHSNCEDEDVIDGEKISRRRTVKTEGRGKVRTFPPPLSSLNRNGKPSFYLRPVRKDGRLELTEVRIERPEILHAWRENGRLTLRLVSDLEEEEEDIEEEEKEEEEEEIEEEEKGIEEENVGEWRLRSSEGLRRCHEMVNHHHHHHVHGSMRMCGISIV
ncbi:protein FANTASTIC FOUR 1-like [Vigna umbellata]|uniref:protein FANTASTIC FOUR 1-like n=1 Tax=Vigna umbellata TaxID=87088 RepID=UPI001F5E9587|nr:protein FANTASTIC FOUR 1-like [Vigna umbellata]